MMWWKRDRNFVARLSPEWIPHFCIFERSWNGNEEIQSQLGLNNSNFNQSRCYFPSFSVSQLMRTDYWWKPLTWRAPSGMLKRLELGTPITLKRSAGMNEWFRHYLRKADLVGAESLRYIRIRLVGWDWNGKSKLWLEYEIIHRKISRPFPSSPIHSFIGEAKSLLIQLVCAQTITVEPNLSCLVTCCTCLMKWTET